MKPSALMLTTDQQIDRRVLLGAASLRSAGWEVTIVGAPAGQASAAEDGIIRIGGTAATAPAETAVATGYRWLRRARFINSGLMRHLKRLAWQYLVNHETYHAKLYWPTLQKLHADVIVANDLPMLPVAARLAEACQAKLVYDSHELWCEQEFPEIERRNWSAVERKYIHRCDAVITVNPSIARELESRYGSTGVKVILNAERCDPPPQRSRYWHVKFDLDEKDLVLLFQGGLSPERNLEALVTAMQGQRDPRIHLVFLGNGPQGATLHALVDKLRLHHTVHFHDAVPQQELLQLTAAADGGIIPYQAICLNNYYCTPNKLFEFIAAGLPILASDLPEIRRIVEGEGMGRVTDLSSPEKIRMAIGEFFSDRDRLRDWSSASVSARSRICWEVEGRKLVSIYGCLV